MKITPRVVRRRPPSDPDKKPLAPCRGLLYSGSAASQNTAPAADNALTVSAWRLCFAISSARLQQAWTSAPLSVGNDAREMPNSILAARRCLVGPEIELTGRGIMDR